MVIFCSEFLVVATKIFSVCMSSGKMPGLLILLSFPRWTKCKTTGLEKKNNEIISTVSEILKRLWQKRKCSRFTGQLCSCFH